MPKRLLSPYYLTWFDTGMYAGRTRGTRRGKELYERLMGNPPRYRINVVERKNFGTRKGDFQCAA